jgi:hypothetical protein
MVFLQLALRLALRNIVFALGNLYQTSETVAVLHAT